MADEWEDYGEPPASTTRDAEATLRHNWSVMVGADERFIAAFQAYLAVPGHTLQGLVDSLPAAAEAKLRARWDAIRVIGSMMIPVVPVPVTLPAKT